MTQTAVAKQKTHRWRGDNHGFDACVMNPDGSHNTWVELISVPLLDEEAFRRIRVG